MQVTGIGHAVLKVRDLNHSEQFYRDVLGLKVCGHLENRMVFFTAGESHHDLALLNVGPDAPEADPKAVGLAHVAFRIGDSFEQLQEAAETLRARGIEIERTSDHRASLSIYFRDPDGNQIEFYVDQPRETWQHIPDAIAYNAPLKV